MHSSEPIETRKCSSIFIHLFYKVLHNIYQNLIQFSWLFVFRAPVSHRYGDYPMLPKRSAHERDPWYQWDQPDTRHNWGEPVRMPVAVFMPLMLLLLNTNTYVYLVLSL